MWDAILARRLGETGLPLLYGLATDDAHNFHAIPSREQEPGRGWVVVLARELTAASLIDALKAGRFYASSGVTLTSIEQFDGHMDINVTPEANVSYIIEFIGSRRGNPAAAGVVLHRAEGTQATYRLQDDDIFVRARVTSSRRHPNPSEPGEFERAWVQPIRGPAAVPELW
jgi:hypothetical protein